MPAQHIICTVRAQTEHRDKVKSLLLELVGPAIAEEGCLYYDINQQNDEPDTFHIVDGWVSAEAVEAHVAHPNVRRVVAGLTPLLSQPLELRTSTRISELTRKPA